MPTSNVDRVTAVGRGATLPGVRHGHGAVAGASTDSAADSDTEIDTEIATEIPTEIPTEIAVAVAGRVAPLPTADPLPTSGNGMTFIEMIGFDVAEPASPLRHADIER
ncbi:hypothetical protein [Stenotrophomonas rhizophila]|uniref:hypothetical protein n=1 Tax=Stenotrophomonas rhizophila TaxID=216778 RepID=UPI000456D16A|nr:hypothetical protein [Stenotrophomonas rhizophila]AHY60337.1 hypothetical protein DX03_16985 [Stenotrophomonas rhizophila]